MDKDKIISIADYVDAKNVEYTKRDKKKPKRKKTIWRFFQWLIATIIVAYISSLVPYYMSPIHTDISALIVGGDFGQIGSNTEVYNIFFEDFTPALEIYLDNNNEGYIRVTEIVVNVTKYDYIKEEDLIYRSDIGGFGDAEIPIYFKTQIEPCIGAMETELDWELNMEYGNDAVADIGSYIGIAEKTCQKFYLTLYTKEQGFYSVEVEICYKYHGKTYTAKTKESSYIFLKQTR